MIILLKSSYYIKEYLMVSYLLHHRYVPIKLHMNFIGDQLTFHRFFLDL